MAASNATVQYDGWPNGTPAFGADVLKIGTPTVLIGTEGGASNYCALPSPMNCPLP